MIFWIFSPISTKSFYYYTGLLNPLLDALPFIEGLFLECKFALLVIGLLYYVIQAAGLFLVKPGAR